MSELFWGKIGKALKFISANSIGYNSFGNFNNNLLGFSKIKK